MRQYTSRTRTDSRSYIAYYCRRGHGRGSFVKICRLKQTEMFGIHTPLTGTLTKDSNGVH